MQAVVLQDIAGGFDEWLTGYKIPGSEQEAVSVLS
jgi:hypothetical protein